MGVVSINNFFSFQSQLYGATNVFQLNLGVVPHLIGFGIGQRSVQKMMMSVLKSQRRKAVCIFYICFINNLIRQNILGEEVITRDCLSSVQGLRTDVPADHYEGCRPAAVDPKLANYVNNSIKELDIYRYVLRNLISKK